MSESELRFRRLFETAQDGILLVNAKTGLIEEVNPYLLHLIGYSRTELLHKKIWDLGFLRDSLANKRNFARLRRDGYIRYKDLPFERKDGTKLEVEFVSNVYRVGDEDIIQCNIRDNTARFRAEAAAKKISVDYADLYNRAPVGYHSFDRQGTIIRINDMELRMLGYRREEVVGRKKFSDLLTAPGRRTFRQVHLPMVMTKGTISPLRYEMVRKDGTTFIGLVNCKAMADKTGRFTLSNGTVADITELELAEEARLASERRFRQLFETSQDGILLVDVATARVEDVNPALVKLLGYSRAALLGKKISKLAFLKDSLADRKKFRELRRHGSLDIAAVPVKTKRGKRLTVEIASNVFRVGTQEIIKCNLRDVTARVHDAEVIWSNEERYRSIFDKGPLGMALSDMKANFFMVNGRFCRMLGYRKQELLKLTFRDITFPADLPGDRKNIALMQRGKLTTYATKKRYLKKDGSLIWATTHVELIRDAAGVPQHFQVMIDDITKHKRAEEALQASLHKYLNLYDSTRDGIVRFDMKGRVMEANPAYQKMLGYALEELKGLKYRQLTVKSFHAEQQRRLNEQILKPDYKGIFEEDYVRKDGSVFNGSSNAWLDRDEKGLPESVWQITRDITDRKRIESIKSDFLTLASHQLRTPLSGHKWLLESLKSERLGPLNAAQKERLDSIYQLNQRMIDLVSEMMQVIHLESGKIEFQSQAIPLGPVISQLLGLVGQSAGRKQIRLDVAFDPLQAPQPKADPRWVQSILECLMANAIEYSPAGQSVVLTLTKEAKHVIFGVEDHGIGIPRHEHKNIFGRFYRASNAKEQEPNGTGLGLSIAQMLAKEMGGMITFESKEGIGSTFRLQLPAA